MPLRDDDTACAAGFRSTHHGSQIVWIFDAVEHNDYRFVRLEERFEVGVRHRGGNR